MATEKFRFKRVERTTAFYTTTFTSQSRRKSRWFNTTIQELKFYPVTFHQYFRMSVNWLHVLQTERKNYRRDVIDVPASF